jgi:hypothetical protein
MFMKKYAIILIAVLLSFSVISCKKCRKEDPRARILNNGNKVVSVQIKTSGGNTENINNVQPGAISDYRSYAAGLVTFTISVDKVNYVTSVEMQQCYEYDIAIDANNQLTSTPRDRNE